MRVCLLTNILAPYRVGFYNELAARCQLTVILDSLMTPDRAWNVDRDSVKFDYVVGDGLRMLVKRRGNGYQSEGRYLQLANRTIPLLRQRRPDVVVSAEMGARTLQAQLYCRMNRVPLVGFWEGTAHTEQSVRPIITAARRFIARNATAFWVNGRDSAAYLHGLGVADASIYPGMTGVDTSHFLAGTEQWRPTRDAEREALGLHGTVFVFSGSLTQRKGIAQYLAALDRLVALRRPQGEFSLLFIGDGELRPEVEAWASRHPSIPVRITGFVQLDQLPRYYICGDWFVLPTLEDCWPLATLEPMVCGLPQIFSTRNGATADLSQWPDAGLIADPANTEHLGQRLADALDRGAYVLPQTVTRQVADFYGSRMQAERAAASLRELASTHVEAVQPALPSKQAIQRTDLTR